MSQEPPYPPPGGPGDPNAPQPPGAPPPPPGPSPGYPPPGYPPPGYGQQGYGQPGYGHPGYPPPGYPPYEQPRRPGLSVWAIIAIVMGSCAALAVLVVLIGGAVMFPVFSRARDSARAASCLSNGKQLGLALQMYAQDYDETFPPAKSWETNALVYARQPSVIICPTQPSSRHAFAYNRKMAGLSLAKIGSPNAQPVFFESRLNQPNASDGGESFDPRHVRSSGKGGVIGFADGSVRILPTAPAADAGLAEGVSTPEP